MDINAYFHFNDNCREAFEFYRSVFGGEFSWLATFADGPAGNCSELRGSADYSAYCGGAAKHEFPKQTVAVPSNVNSYPCRYAGARW